MTCQAIITLNIMRTLHMDPSKSAYHQLHGNKYDWNAHSMALPGARAVIYEGPDNITSWGARGTNIWYCCPAINHYHNCKFYVPATRAYRTSGSFHLFPQHYLLPKFTLGQDASEVYDELVESIQNMKTCKFETAQEDGEGAKHPLHYPNRNTN